LSKFFLTKIWDKPKDMAESRANATPIMVVQNSGGAIKGNSFLV
jgi:hypothetical protein